MTPVLTSDWSQVGVFSVSSSDEPDYWAKADYDTWLLEMAGDR